MLARGDNRETGRKLTTKALREHFSGGLTAAARKHTGHFQVDSAAGLYPNNCLYARNWGVFVEERVRGSNPRALNKNPPTTQC